MWGANVNDNQIISITKGEKKVFSIFVVVGEDERPKDLTDYTKLKVSLKKEDGTYLLLTETDNAGSIVAKTTPNQLGELQVTVMPAHTKLLEESDALDIDVELDKVSPDPLRRRLVKVLQVIGSSIPVV